MRAELSHWWRSFLNIVDEARRTALDILRQRYVDESEHARQFNQHARQMHYPQFRETLLHIAAEETEHARLLAKKIVDLGGKLPDVTGERASTQQSSWQHLLKDLNEEGHCAGEWSRYGRWQQTIPTSPSCWSGFPKRKRNIVTNSARCSCAAMHLRDARVVKTPGRDKADSRVTHARAKHLYGEPVTKRASIAPNGSSTGTLDEFRVARLRGAFAEAQRSLASRGSGSPMR